MNNDSFIGIDPGLGGGICRIIPGESVEVYPWQGESEAIDLLRGWSISGGIVGIELVGGFIKGKKLPGSTMGKMCRNAGFWKGASLAFGFSVHEYRPQDWQKGLGLPSGQGKSKDERKRKLKDIAAARYPSLTVTLKTADAIMIADYCWRMNTRSKL